MLHSQLHYSEASFPLKTVSMATKHNKSITTGRNAKKIMEQLSPELIVKSYRDKRRQLLKPFQTTGPSLGKVMEQKKPFMREYSRASTPQPISSRSSYPSYRGALKWMKDNRETIDTLVELLHIHPELLKHKFLGNFQDFLRTYKSKLHYPLDRLKRKHQLESIPTITVTQDDVPNSDNIHHSSFKTRLVIVGRHMFEQDCGDLISGLTEFFAVYCLGDDESSYICDLLNQTDSCLFLLSASVFDQHDILMLLQQIRCTNIKMVFLKTSEFSVPKHIKQDRRYTAGSNCGNERKSPFSLPLPPISSSPDFLTIDSSFASDLSITFLLEASKQAIIYNKFAINDCVEHIVCHINKEDDQTVLESSNKLYDEMESLTINDDKAECRLKPEHVIDSKNTSSKDLFNGDTLGASLIVMEHMTYRKYDHNGLKSKQTKKAVDLPKLEAWKTPPVTPLFRKEKVQSKTKGIGADDYHKKLNHSENLEMISWLPEGSTDNTTYLLFSDKRGELPAKINWPEDVKDILSNEDCISEDSGSIGFQDIDFSSCMWSCYSDDD